MLYVAIRECNSGTWKPG